ncbi:MAG TPA: L,D-transpeptidase [Patescibacteria group bacterium]|nr:L,D-transpeptidase [Patescibacteria group bacterium]
MIPFVKTRPIPLISLLLLLSLLVVSQTNFWFFLRTGQPQIDFARATGEYEEADRVPIYHGAPVREPFLVEDTQDFRVLGKETGVEKRIEVDLTNQRLYAFEGDRRVFDFVISSGKPWWPTPTGEFRIWIKLRYQKMSGGSRALGTYYYLPNVPYIMFFSNEAVPGYRGYGLHGTYWHNNFGHPMSHGCVNLRTEDAAQLFYWAAPYVPVGKNSVQSQADNPGTRILIYGETPKS